MSDIQTGIGNMTRKEVIHQLKGLLLGELRTTTKERKALDYAIASLETDEAYQLEYEKPTTKDDHHKQNIQAYAHDFGVSEEQAEKELRVTPQEPRKGHWIGNYQVDFGEWQEYDVKLSDGFVTDNCHCSECGEELLSGDRGMFCPYCGSDNREVVEE